MIYLLDTTTFSDLMREESHTVARLAAVSDGNEVMTCTIVRGEILFGLSLMPEGKRHSSFEAKAGELFETIPCCAVPPDAGDHYAEVRLARQSAGRTLDANDTWIAATALALGASLVSRDSDFRRIPDLEVEDWSR